MVPYLIVDPDTNRIERFHRDAAGNLLPIESGNPHPAPGPADGPWPYGHNRVSLAIIMKHSLWGTVVCPILSKLDVRRGCAQAHEE